MESLPSYQDVLKPDARLHFLVWMSIYGREADGIEAQDGGKGTTHRIRLKSHTFRGEFRISGHDYSLEMLRIIALVSPPKLTRNDISLQWVATSYRRPILDLTGAPWTHSSISSGRNA